MYECSDCDCELLYQADVVFLSEFQGFSLLDRSLHWSAALMELEDISRNIGKFFLGVVPWLRQTETPEPFWPLHENSATVLVVEAIVPPSST